MDLVERYLQGVRFWLPRGQQDDVAAELGEDIRSQIEEQEGKLGRRLAELEVALVLKERGRPMLVANRYRPQQYLIGPALFPTYRFVIIIVSVCYLIPWVLTWYALRIFDPHFHANFGQTFGPLWGTFWVTLFVAFGTVTLVFAILERANSRTKFLENWDPLRLPAERDPRRISRINSAIDLAANVAFSVWWVTNMWSTTVFDHIGIRIVFAPVWKVFLWVLLLLAIAAIILAAVNLVCPYWTWLRASVQLALAAAAAAAFCAMFKANLVAEIVSPEIAPLRAAGMVNTINTFAMKLFPFTVIACAVIVALSGTDRLIRLRNSRKRMAKGFA